MQGQQPSRRTVSQLAAFLLLFLAGLASGRILYELAFPHLLWLGRLLPALLFATLVATLLWVLWRQTSRAAVSAQTPHPVTRSPGRPLTQATAGCPPPHPLTLSPLLLNLLYLFEPAVDLTRSRFIFVASLWLVGLLLAQRLARPQSWRWPGVVFVVMVLLPIYLLTMSHTVGRADTFEFQVVAPQLGIAHPTGYPLYLLLGKLFTLLPVSSVAWRLNFASAVYALAAAGFVFLFAYRLLQRPLPAVLGAVALSLTPTFWSQAIEAEVYTLHALIVAIALWLMREIGDWRLGIRDWRLRIGNSPLERKPSKEQAAILLFFVIGLGLTNHLTSLFLLPPAVLTLLLAFRRDHQSPISNLQSLISILVAFLFPLSLYAYLPLRWAAVNREPMGLSRFVDWVMGGRFQGALQWTAWLNDPARYEVVGRLFLDNWGWFNLLLALVGFVFLLSQNWRAALVLLVTWFGYTFYCLNYYVPDLAVFLLPAQMIVAICWANALAIGVWRPVLSAAEGLEIGDNLQSPMEHRTIPNLQSLILILLIIPVLMLAIRHWPQVDRSGDDGLTQWGTAVLALPLDANAAILADSEKIAPLYYLQQSEGIQPDLDIMVLPDEAAYRAELDSRIAAGQTVYLARFLPGLAGVYHLRSLGPLVEVSAGPLPSLPAGATPSQLDFGSIQLVAYDVEPAAAVDPTATAVTLYWQAPEPASEALNVYVRWSGESFTGDPDVAAGQHPANNTYPTNAWRPGEIVPDYHQWPQPILSRPQTLGLQVALASPFTPADELNWTTITETAFTATDNPDLPRLLRAQVGPLLLHGAQFLQQIRPQTLLPVLISGFGNDAFPLHLSLHPIPNSQSSMSHRTISNLQSPMSHRTIPNLQSPFLHTAELNTDLPNGRYQLIASHPLHDGAVCGWLAPVTAGCVLGEVEISGVPLPEGAVNFDDKIALLEIEVPDNQLQPGGQFPVTLTWQALAPIDQDYTVFVQILDQQDQIVGQIDAWPRQGTYPTGQWTAGEIVRDPYVVQLQGELQSGEYRLQVGWYLLATLHRLPVLNESGASIDDKVVVPSLLVP